MLFHSQHHNCPNCGVETAVHRLMSTEGYVAVDLDYRVYARGADPTRLLATRCSACSFAEYVTDFKKPTGEAVRRAVESDSYRQLVRGDRASDFPLIALVKIAKGEPHERVGYCYLRASWFSADLGRIDEERAYLTQAAEWFRRALNSGNIMEQERDRTHYLLAEIHRRLGHFTDAERELAAVISPEFSGLVRDERNLIAKKDTLRRRVKAR